MTYDDQRKFHLGYILNRASNLVEIVHSIPLQLCVQLIQANRLCIQTHRNAGIKTIFYIAEHSHVHRNSQFAMHSQGYTYLRRFGKNLAAVNIAIVDQ